MIDIKRYENAYPLSQRYNKCMIIYDLWEKWRWEIVDLFQFETNDAFCNKNDKYDLIPQKRSFF